MYVFLIKYLYLFKIRFYFLIVVTIIFKYKIEILILLVHLEEAHVFVWWLETGLLAPSVWAGLHRNK